MQGFECEALNARLMIKLIGAQGGEKGLQVWLHKRSLM